MAILYGNREGIQRFHASSTEISS